MPQLTSVNFYGDALVVCGRVARIIAANIANADTPGYKARGIDFSKALAAQLNGTGGEIAAQYERGLPVGLDGNNVSLEHEGVHAAANATRLRESLAFLKSDTQSLITALRPQGGGSQGG